MKVAARPQLKRLAVIDRSVRCGEYPNATKIAREVKVAARTIHRDIRFLRDAWSAPLVWSDERQGFYYSDPDFQLPLLTLTDGELVALFLAERLLQQYRGTPYAAAIATAFGKLTSALPEKVTMRLEDLGHALSVRPAPVPKSDVTIFSQLVRAIREERQVRITYCGVYRDQETERVIDPYHLAAVSDGFCVYAYCHLREDIRTFRPSRIRKLEETGVVFQRPADFDVTRYFDGAFGIVQGEDPQAVRLRLYGLAARLVPERDWHPSQKIRHRRDGHVEVSFRLSHLAEIKRWVLAWGSECEVLTPAELRREVATDIAKLDGMYFNDERKMTKELKPHLRARLN